MFYLILVESTCPSRYLIYIEINFSPCFEAYIYFVTSGMLFFVMSASTWESEVLEFDV